MSNESNNLLIANVDLLSSSFSIFSLQEEVFGCREARGEERENEEEVDDCLGVHGCGRLGYRCQSVLFLVRAVFIKEGSKNLLMEILCKR